MNVWFGLGFALCFLLGISWLWWLGGKSDYYITKVPKRKK
jgi:hypothetical protein